MISLDYIITGTGRCGTLFAANFLTSAGIPCTHEAVFTYKGIHFAWSVLSGSNRPVSSKISKGDNLSDYEMDVSAESSYMSAPFLGDFLNSKVIHMIRNPIDTIRSFISFEYFSRPHPVHFDKNPEHRYYEEFIYWAMPELQNDMPQLDRACLYWVGWNEMIEHSGRVNYVQRLEDSKEGLSEFLGSKGTYSKVSNAYRQAKEKWSPTQIQSPTIRRRLKDFAKKHGYLSILH